MRKEIVIHRGSTPTIRLSLKGAPLGNVQDIRVSFKNGDYLFEKGMDHVCIEGGCILVCRLSQEETMRLDSIRPLVVQVRVRTNGAVYSSIVRQFRVANSIGREVLGDV